MYGPSPSPWGERLRRVQRLWPAVWLGLLLCVALVATPSPFAVLDRPLAGRVVARILAQEAWLSLWLSLLGLLWARAGARRDAGAGQGSAFSTDMLLLLGVLACTLLGYFGLQPQMAAARAGQGLWSFGQLHAASSVLYALKLVLVAVLAWRQVAAGPGAGGAASASSPSANADRP